MAGTILEYLEEYGGKTLDEVPFNEVDCLVLSQFSYLKLDGLVPYIGEGEEAVTIKQLAEHKEQDCLFTDTRYEKENRALFDKMVSGSRFGQLRLNFYVNLIEKQWEAQFSAVTLFLEDGRVVIAFRGTDETIVGWKEDFNMAFGQPIPSQICSVKYLEMAVRALGKENGQDLVLCGHSKGGNLAVYAAMKCPTKLQRRIRKVYSMDGPGFRPEILTDGCYEKIAERVVKYRPYSSLVGILFEQDPGYQVVGSKTYGLAQHDPYTWLVSGEHFVKVSGIRPGRRFLDDTINEWLLSLSQEELHVFVETLYQVVSASEAEDLIVFAANMKKSMTGIVNALKMVDPSVKEKLKEILKSLFRIGAQRLRQELSGR